MACGVEACRQQAVVISAQVKSAILLAGLRADGITTVIEEKPTRDHSENMLRHFGVNVEVQQISGGAEAIHLRGGQDMIAGNDIFVPSDPSSAAFPAVAALLNEGSDIILPRIGMNPRRNGVFINGARVAEGTVRPGDVVRIGHFSIR